MISLFEYRSRVQAFLPTSSAAGKKSLRLSRKSVCTLMALPFMNQARIKYMHVDTQEIVKS